MLMYIYIYTYTYIYICVHIIIVNLVMQQPSVRAGVPDLGTSPRWEGEET